MTGANSSARAVRFEDWPSRLDAAVLAARLRPFDLTAHNCASFAADCVEAITGIRHHESFAALMATQRDALRAAADLRTEVSLRLGAPIEAGMARRGDVVLIDHAGRVLVGIWLGQSAVAVSDAGIGTVSRKECACAWPI